MNTRLLKFLEAEGLTQAQFADRINVARAVISHIIAGRNKPGYDFLINTMHDFPGLNIEWLLTGKGEMYKDKSLRIENSGSSNTDAGDTLFSRAENPSETAVEASAIFWRHHTDVLAYRLEWQHIDHTDD